IAYLSEFTVNLFPGLILEETGKFRAGCDRTTYLKRHLQEAVGLDAMETHPPFIADVGVQHRIIETSQGWTLAALHKLPHGDRPQSLNQLLPVPWKVPSQRQTLLTDQ